MDQAPFYDLVKGHFGALISGLETSPNVTSKLGQQYTTKTTYFCNESESMMFVLSLEDESLTASMAERRLSMLAWPRAVRPVAFDMVLDLVIRDLGGVPPVNKNVTILFYKFQSLTNQN